jgi:hypothetical protein
MKELDFDELDRAVNSLMTDAPSAAPPKEDAEDKETVLDITSTVSGGPVPSFGENPTQTVAASTPSATSSRTEPTSAPLAARRGGRFMDVVHPSSDMKKPTIPSRPNSRQGLTINPTRTADQLVSQETSPVASAAPVQEPAPATSTDMLSPIEPKTSSADEWPDPLDFKGGEHTPLTTPFLPDTKVEKRPLGNGLPTTPAEEPDHTPVLDMSADQSSLTTDNPDAQLPATPPELELQLPEELQDDLMVVEADTHMGLPKTEDVKLTEKEVEPKPELVTPSKAPKSSMPSMEPPEEPLLTAGPTSIPQQYREEPNTGDQASGAIYDTDSYHQPLAHPAKKKSGWMWVIGIIIILLVGAGGGAALYFMGIV